MEPTTEKWNTEKLKSKKLICSEVSVTVRGIHGVSHEEDKEGYGGKDLQKRKVLSLEWKSEWVMDDEWWVEGTNGGSAKQRIG